MSRRAVLAGLLLALAPLSASASECPSLSRGSTGSAVSAVQQILFDAYAGFPSPTGYFGPTTEAAVKQWQKEHGIEQLGIVGPQTAASLGVQLCSASDSTAAASSGDEQSVTASQSLIDALLAQLKTLQAKLASLIAAANASTTTLSTPAGTPASTPAPIASTPSTPSSPSPSTPPSVPSSPQPATVLNCAAGYQVSNGACVPVTPAATTTPVHDWLVFAGDSRTDPSGSATGDGPGHTWPYLLVHNDPAFSQQQVYNEAINGYTTLGVLNQFIGGVYHPNASGSVYLFVWVGVNDIGRTDPATAYANLKSIWSRARSLGYKVIALTAGPACLSGDQATQLAQLNADIASDTSLYDLLVRPENILPDPCTDTNHSYFFDIVHPNANGNARLEAGIEPILADWLH